MEINTPWWAKEADRGIRDLVARPSLCAAPLNEDLEICFSDDLPSWVQVFDSETVPAPGLLGSNGRPLRVLSAGGRDLYFRDPARIS